MIRVAILNSPYEERVMRCGSSNQEKEEKEEETKEVCKVTNR